MPSSQQFGICCAVYSVNKHLLNIWGNVFEELKSPSSLGQQYAGLVVLQHGCRRLPPKAEWGS